MRMGGCEYFVSACCPHNKRGKRANRNVNGLATSEKMAVKLMSSLVVCGPLVAVMWGAHGVSVWGFIVGSKKVTLG